MSSAALKSLNKAGKGVYVITSGASNSKNLSKEVLSSVMGSRFGVYVTLNRSYTEMVKQLQTQKIKTDKLLFIDGVGAKCEVDSQNCISLEGNKSLTELSLILSKAGSNSSIKFIIFDSLNSLLLYNKVESCERFVHYLINKVKNMDVLLAILAVNGEKVNHLISVASQLSDKVIEL
ncbi:hypothetical protein COV20_00820 [Candidatus Woesearchaeota archaeon CG10_big_fil_rev_8_21_14_0_10_45_16]|nr:MAG: hypothetical protein COV20_00820 [Candidatus Woesearchaeota archaeon CG10_big_fil_rev_8_21_14_0_10_45_16]